MANLRRIFLGTGLGFAVGATVVFLLDAKTREKLWEEFGRQWENLRLKIKEYQRRIDQAIEAGKEASRLREQELHKEISPKKRVETESPDYIV